MSKEEEEKKSRFFFLPFPHPLPKVLKWFDQVPDTRPNLAEILCVPTVSESSCRLSRTRFKKYGKPFKNGAMMELRISCHQVRVLNSKFFFSHLLKAERTNEKNNQRKEKKNE
jgi:hypothetical protein